MDRIGTLGGLLSRHGHVWICKQGPCNASKCAHSRCIQTLLTRGPWPWIHKGSNSKFSFRDLNSSPSCGYITEAQIIDNCAVESRRLRTSECLVVTRSIQRCGFHTLNGRFSSTNQKGLINSQPCHSFSKSLSCQNDSKSENPGETSENATQTSSSESADWEDDRITRLQKKEKPG